MNRQPKLLADGAQIPVSEWVNVATTRANEDAQESKLSEAPQVSSRWSPKSSEDGKAFLRHEDCCSADSPKIGRCSLITCPYTMCI